MEKRLKDDQVKAEQRMKDDKVEAEQRMKDDQVKAEQRIISYQKDLEKDFKEYFNKGQITFAVLIAGIISTIVVGIVGTIDYFYHKIALNRKERNAKHAWVV